MKKFISLFLVLTLVFGAVSSSFALASSDDKIYNDKIYTIKMLDGKTLTQEEFIGHLEKHSDQIVKLDNTETQNEPTRGHRSIGALVAGTWWIPGVGEVVITTAGVIIIGGAIIATGCWLYNKVVDWFAAKAEIEAIADKIPSKLMKGKTQVDTGKFTDKVNGKQAYKNKKTGWSIEKDHAGGNSHGGSYWKLKDKSGKRIATLDKKGNILRK